MASAVGDTNRRAFESPTSKELGHPPMRPAIRSAQVPCVRCGDVFVPLVRLAEFGLGFGADDDVVDDEPLAAPAPAPVPSSNPQPQTSEKRQNVAFVVELPAGKASDTSLWKLP